MKKIISLALALLLLVSLSASALATGSVEISTVIRPSYTVTVACNAGGKYTVNSTDYTSAHAFTVTRHESFTLTAAASEDYAIKSISSDSSSGLTLGTDSATVSSVCRDFSITVSFRSTLPPTPTPVPTPTPTPTPTSTPKPTPVPSKTPKPTPTPTPTPSPPRLVVPVVGEDEKITAEAVITGDSAELTVDEGELNTLLQSDTRAQTLTVDVSGLEVDVNTVVIPVTTVQAVAEQAASDDSELTGMDVVMSSSAVTFDAAALNAIAQQAPQDTVSLHVEEVGTDRLSPEQLSSLADAPESAIVVEVTLRSGDTVISDFRGGTAEIKLPYTPKPNEDTSTITVWFLAQDGTMEELPCRYEAGFVIFTVSHFSNYIVKSGRLTVDIPTAAAPDNGAGSHCFICRWLDKDIAPWCWLAPVLVLVALAGGCWLAFKKSKNKKQDIGY